MAVGAYADVFVATVTTTAFMRRSVGFMTFYTSLCLPVFGMAVDAGGYVLVMFAVAYREVVVYINMAGSAHLFCQGVLENGIPDRKMRVAVAAEADAPVPQ